MYNYTDDELEAYRRKERGLPPLKEITLPSDAIRTAKQVGNDALRILQKEAAK
jgi:hypothetical protein